MPCLIVFYLPGPSKAGLEDYDVCMVIPHTADPGRAVRANTPARYGFVYCSDRNASQLRYLVDPEYSTTDTSAEGGDVGDFPRVRRRRYRCLANLIPGHGGRYSVYREWRDNNAIKVAFADFDSSYSEDKRTR